MRFGATNFSLFLMMSKLAKRSVFNQESLHVNPTQRFLEEKAMALSAYGMPKGIVVGHQRDADHMSKQTAQRKSSL